MGKRTFMKNWTVAQMDAYIAKKKAKEFYDQDRPITPAMNNIVNVGVMPFGFTPDGTSPNNLLKGSITEQGLTILALVDAASETHIAHQADKIMGSVQGGLLFTPARVGITLWDGAAPGTGTSGLTGKTGIKKYQTRSGTIPFGDVITGTKIGEAVTRVALASKIRSMTQTANKLRGLSFKPELLTSGRVDKGVTKTNLTPTTATLSYGG
ncbi:MAG: hypothetical protein ACOVLB_05495 [Candidatus Nanopelagicus sp.]